MVGNYVKYLTLFACLFMVSCVTRQVVPDEQVENYGNHSFDGIDLIETDTIE